MIKVVAMSYVKEGKLDEYVALAKPLVNQTRKEIGCVSYELCADRAKNLATMVESWESPAALNKHLSVLKTSSYFAQMQALSDNSKPGSLNILEVVL